MPPPGRRVRGGEIYFDEKLIRKNGLFVPRSLKALNPDWPGRIIEAEGDATICGVVVFKGEVF